MSYELKRYKLKDLIEVTRGQSLSGDCYAKEGEKLRLTLANFDYDNGGFKYDTQKDDLYYTGTVKPQCLLKEGDIITPLTEQTPGLLGSTARIPESDKFIQSGDVALVKCKEGLIDPSFCYYLLPSTQVKKQLAAGSQQTKIRHTSPDAIMDCVVDIPSIDEQKRIGAFLDALTELTNKKREQIKMLEDCARKLYNYWFIQFDFPNEEGLAYKANGGTIEYNEQLKRELPKGWKTVVMEDLLDKVPSTKSFPSKSYKPDGEFSIIDQSPEYIIGYTDDKDNIIFKHPAIVFGDHSTNIKYVDFPFGRGADGTQIIYSKDSAISQLYLYHYLKATPIPNPGYQRHFKYVKEMIVPIPPKDIVDEFTTKTTAIYDMIKQNTFEIKQLRKLYSYMTPLLMAGQVSLK